MRIFFAILLLQAVSCGQKGPLELPDESAAGARAIVEARAGAADPHS